MFHHSLRLITFGGRYAHSAYHVQKSDIITAILRFVNIFIYDDGDDDDDDDDYDDNNNSNNTTNNNNNNNNNIFS